MFSKSKINQPGPKQGGDATPAPGGRPDAQSTPMSGEPMTTSSAALKSKPKPSTLSSDLTISGNMRTTGDIQVEGTVKGDIRAHLLTIGESANVEGEVVADDVIVTGRVVGKVRGLKVRLTSSARVEGDIIHKTIAIESGAHFEGSVQRAEDPLANGGGPAPRVAAAPAAGSVPRPPAAGAASVNRAKTAADGQG